MIRHLFMLVSAAMLVVSAAVASANPAGALRVSLQSQRTEQARPTSRRGIPGGGIFAAVILAGVIAVAVLLATEDEKPDSP